MYMYINTLHIIEINAVGLIKRIKKDVLIIYPTHKHIVSKKLHTFLLLMEVTCTLQHTNFYLILKFST